MEHFKEINLDKIREARKRIAPLIRQTPLMHSTVLSNKWKKNIGLKLENLQPTGAFKLRGAANAILSLSEAEKNRGVVTMSTGNHGKAVAYVAKKLGVNATVCISNLVPKIKVDAMKALGITVKVTGKNQDEALEYALQLQEREGLKYISPFDDPNVIAGQATTMLEVLEQNPNTDTLIVPVGGGGLMSGMAFVAKVLDPSIRMIGVTNDTEPAMYKSLKAGHIVQVDEFESLADALPGPISENNQYTFAMCQRYVDDMVLICEEQIAQAMAYALLKEKQVLEGGGAAVLSVLIEGNYTALGQDVVAICSGNSVDMSLLFNLTNKYQKDIDDTF